MSLHELPVARGNETKFVFGNWKRISEVGSNERDDYPQREKNEILIFETDEFHQNSERSMSASSEGL